MRTCPSCKETSDNWYKKWRCSYCITCWRNYSKRYREAHVDIVRETNRRSWAKNEDQRNTERKFGGRSLYLELLEQQNGVCKICKNPERSNRYRRLCVDHCHTTNKIRGLLCSNCNRALGLFKDNYEVLQAAVEYLCA